MAEDELFLYEYDDDDEVGMLTHCPACRTEYDAIDYEYQICHWCKHEAGKE